MKIAIEAQRIFRTNKHGMDFVILEALKQLQKIDKDNEYFVFVAGGEDRCLEQTPNMHIIELKCSVYPIWEQILLPRAVKKVGADILHCTSNTAPIFCKMPLILTLHDIIFLEKRQSASKSLYQNLGWYYRKLVVPKIIHKCKRIITVSNFEKKRIMDALHLSDKLVVAIYNGFSSHFKQIDNCKSVFSQYLQDDNYLFFLGNTDPKKNTSRILQAYKLYLDKSGKKQPLLIADLDEKYVDELLTALNIPQIKQYLRFGGYIKNTNLPYVYGGASAFIYASLRESFGIPILEAMACGTPIITSNVSSMPEIAGEDAILVDPLKPEEIAGKLLQLEEDESFYNKMKDYGLERVKLFSWSSTAEQMLKLYNQVYKELN